MNVSRIARWICAALLAVVFVLVGISKLAGAPAERWSERFSHWGYPAAVRPVVGVIQILAAICVLVPKTRRVAAATLAATMAGALATHVVHGEFPRTLPPLVLGALALFVGAGRDRPPR